MPKVSVIMPVFNGEKYIGESIASVLAQRSTDLELIVVNDGSTDNTLEIAKAFVEADARVQVISRSHSGRPSIPKNDGIAVARGEYVCFLDHDDLLGSRPNQPVG
ncbi:MAG: glycosyltransferase [Sphingomonadales bacterium]|nr:glycosyltransferase [Sphingomonadales bacterium]